MINFLIPSSFWIWNLLPFVLHRHSFMAKNVKITIFNNNKSPTCSFANSILLPFLSFHLLFWQVWQPGNNQVARHVTFFNSNLCLCVCERERCLIWFLWLTFPHVGRSVHRLHGPHQHVCLVPLQCST